VNDIFETPAEPDTAAVLSEAMSGPDPTGYDVRLALSNLIAEGLSEQAMTKIKKQVKDICDEIESDLDWGIKDNLSINLADFTCDMANKAVKALLAGDEKLMRQYLSCREYDYTGRDREHAVIHGTLSEYSPITLRKQIVDAFPDLLKNERILDLESQVASLVKQVNAEKSRADRFAEELRGYR
jgi:hypothetical protein